LACGLSQSEEGKASSFAMTQKTLVRRKKVPFRQGYSSVTDREGYCADMFQQGHASAWLIDDVHPIAAA
jgi:hypothetical protein